MPTLADQEGRARQDDCGGWDQEDDGGWLSDWEERRETTRRGSAEQGQLKDAPGPEGGPEGEGVGARASDSGYPFL